MSMFVANVPHPIIFVNMSLAVYQRNVLWASEKGLKMEMKDITILLDSYSSLFKKENSYSEALNYKEENLKSTFSLFVSR